MYITYICISSSSKIHEGMFSGIYEWVNIYIENASHNENINLAYLPHPSGFPTH